MSAQADARPEAAADVALDAPLLEVERAITRYPVARGIVGAIARRPALTVHAVEGVSFTVGPGEMVALVGESGCGKTSTAQTVVRMVDYQAGAIRFRGREIGRLSQKDLRPLRREIQMIYQDPYESLDPRFTVRDAVEEPLLVHGMGGSSEEREAKVREALGRAGLTPPELYIDRYPHELSGGQRQRVAIAASLVLDPKLLVADEPVSMLDVSVRAGILSLLDGLRKDGMGILMITHDLSTAAHFADRIAVMYLGRIVEEGPAREVVRNPQHPYTQALISVVPKRDPREHTVPQILSGETPNPVQVPSGCRFHPRCPVAEERCKQVDPSLQHPAGANVLDHRAACIITAPGPSTDEVGPDAGVDRASVAQLRTEEAGMPWWAPSAVLQYSGWWRRLWALIIDLLIIAGVSLIISLPLLFFGGTLELITPFVLVLVNPVYFTAWHGNRSGQTVGKHLLGIAVRDVETRVSIGYRRAFLRWLVFDVLFIIPLIGVIDVLCPLWDSRHQAIHDKLMSSSVFRLK
jgi:oligopeptide/dipeptide ABC transporter ATP-binding protein